MFVRCESPTVELYFHGQNMIVSEEHLKVTVIGAADEK